MKIIIKDLISFPKRKYFGDITEHQDHDFGTFELSKKEYLEYLQWVENKKNIFYSNQKNKEYNFYEIMSGHIKINNWFMEQAKEKDMNKDFKEMTTFELKNKIVNDAMSRGALLTNEERLDISKEIQERECNAQSKNNTQD